MKANYKNRMNNNDFIQAFKKATEEIHKGQDYFITESMTNGIPTIIGGFSNVDYGANYNNRAIPHYEVTYVGNKLTEVKKVDTFTGLNGRDNEYIATLRAGIKSMYLPDNDPLQNVMPIKMTYRDGDLISATFIEFGRSTGLKKLKNGFDSTHLIDRADYIGHIVWQLTD